MPLSYCRTPRCTDWQDLSRFGFCPSCRFIGRVCFYVGAAIAGAIVGAMKVGGYL